MTPKTFFSYSRTDTEFTRKLATDLRNAGADLWIDQLDIQPGTRWDMEIEKALKASETVIVVLSPNAVASNNIMDEISYALENDKKVIPVIIEQCEIPFRVKRLQYIDFTQNYDNGLKRLSTVLNLDGQNILSSSPEAEEPMSTGEQPKLAAHEPASAEKTSSYKTHQVKSDEILSEKKAFSKWVYFGAGAVVLIIVLIFLIKLGKSSGNDTESENDSTNISADKTAVSDPVVDSLYADSLFNLGNTGVAEKNYEIAIQHFEKSAELGNSKAMNQLCDIYKGIYSPNHANFENVLYWLRKGVDKNNLNAMYSYGLLLNGNNISDYFTVPEEVINRDSAMYYWNIVNSNTPGGVLGYKKTGG